MEVTWYNIKASLEKHCTVEEAAVQYSNEPYEAIWDNKIGLAEFIHEGLPLEIVDILKQYYSTQFIADMMGISTRTLSRMYKSNDILDESQSEKALALLEVTVKGVDTFGSWDSFQSWFSRPVRQLSMRKPEDLVRNSYGKELILDQLTKIDYGLFS